MVIAFWIKKWGKLKKMMKSLKMMVMRTGKIKNEK